MIGTPQAASGPQRMSAASFGRVWLLFLALAAPLASAQTIDTVAGNGSAGFAGDSGQATAASLNTPQGVASDAAGNVYIADRMNHRVRKMDAAGVITTIAGTGTAGFNGDGIAATGAQLNHPVGLALDSSGNLYIADSSNHRIRRVSAGVITTVAGTGAPGYTGDDMAATSSGLTSPFGVAWAGDLYIADTGSHRVRRVSGGIITTVAGNGSPGFGGDGGPATLAVLSLPIGLSVGDGLYVADYGNRRIRKIIPGSSISTVAGNGIATFSGDGGAATSASLNNPTHVAWAASGDLYIADQANHRIRKVTAGVISTFAGTGTATFGGDGGPPGSASLSAPVGLAIDALGDLLIADANNHRVRLVTFPRAPDAPVIGTATAGDAQISVEFTPGDDGGMPILEFVATCAGQSQSGTASPIVVTGLVNGVTYNCTVVATNAAGTSLPSAPSNDATPKAPTTTTLSGPATSSTFDPVTFTATVTGTSPTGTVAFSGGLAVSCAAQPVVAGQASCETYFSGPGNYVVSATYSGDAVHASSIDFLPHSVTGGYDLVVTRSGSGSGSVSSPTGIDCGSDCGEAELAPLTSVTLTASPDAGSVVSWSGVVCAEGQASLTCTFIMTGNRTATANFELLTYIVTASVNGAPGTVGMSITTCGAGCAVVPHGTSITFTAAAGGSASLASWSGVTCNEGNSSSVCTVTVTSNLGATANFGYSVSVTKVGTGSVTSSPAGISCGAACSFASFVYMPGTEVTLTAVGLAGSTFQGWSSGACSGTGPCVITAGLSAGVLATFSGGGVVVAPGVPRLASATGGDSEVTLRFAPPASDGGEPPTYHASCTPGLNTTTGPASPLVMTGLTNGTSYACVVTALNSAGSGPSTIEMTATPLAAVTGPLAYIATTTGVAVIESATYRTHATIGVPASRVAVSPSGSRAYFTDAGDAVVHVIDAATSSIVGSVAVGAAPKGVAFSPAGDRAYVSSSTPSKIDVIDTASAALVGSIPVASILDVLAFKPDGSRLYGTAGGNLHVIDPVSQEVSLVPVGFDITEGVAVNPAGTRIYVTGTTLPSTAGTVVLDASTLAIVTTVPAPHPMPHGVAVSPTGARTYVVVGATGTTLVALDNATNTQVDSIDITGGQTCNPSSCPVGLVAPYPDNARILAGFFGFNGMSGARGIRVVDAATFTVITDIDATLTPFGVAIAPTVPGAPTIGSATPGNGTASIAFTPPALNGGSVITGYTVSCSGGFSASGAASPIVVTGLANGVSYTCSATAANAVGTGAASATVDVTPASVAAISTAPATNVAFAGLLVGSTSAAQSVAVTSAGNANLLVGTPTITGAHAGDFAISSNDCGTVAPAQTCTIQLTFTPTAGGARSASLGIPSNDPATPLKSIALSGSGIALDTTPDAFAFTDVVGVARGSVQTSNAITISGINVPAAISVTNGEYSIGCTAVFATAGGTVSNGQTVCVRHTSSSSYSTATDTTLTVGGVSDAFTSTTIAAQPQFTLTVAKAGTGSGTITGPGISCGLDCAETANSGTAIALTAAAGTGSTFTGWSGAGCSGTGGCTVTLDADKTATATFTLNQYTVSTSAGANGTISPTSRQVNHGATTTFTVTPSAGYAAQASGCGGVLAGTTYTTGAVTAPCTVTAAFTAIDPPRLGNISTRMQVLTGNDVMIGGFVIGGSASKTVVVRARGPSLIPFGITNALANPQLQLVRSSDQQTIAMNDDWQSASNAADVTASGFAPSNNLEAAILVSLPPGAYTAIVSGVGSGTGVGIVEVFEVDGPLVPLANISTRGQVLTGNDVMIGGFVIQGSGPQTVVVRARGPSLVPFGITNALANPQLQLVRSSDQQTVAMNDDWQSATNAADVTASGFAPSNVLESAILITLQPGAYTAIVTGAAGGTGVGIVEVFRVP